MVLSARMRHDVKDPKQPNCSCFFGHPKRKRSPFSLVETGSASSKRRKSLGCGRLCAQDMRGDETSFEEVKK